MKTSYDILYPEEVRNRHINYLLKKFNQKSKKRITICSEAEGGYMEGFGFYYRPKYKNILIVGK
jgi:hypothetical protein